MTFIVAANIVASRPPERRPTGTSHANANICLVCSKFLSSVGCRLVHSWDFRWLVSDYVKIRLEKRPWAYLGKKTGPKIANFGVFSISLMSIIKSECGAGQPSPPKVIFHQRSSPPEGRLPPKVFLLHVACCTRHIRGTHQQCNPKNGHKQGGGMHPHCGSHSIIKRTDNRHIGGNAPTL